MRSLPFDEHSPLSALKTHLSDPAVSAVHLDDRQLRIIKELKLISTESPLDAEALGELSEWCKEHGQMSNQSTEVQLIAHFGTEMTVKLDRMNSGTWRATIRLLPVPLPTLDDLSRRGMLSPLAARMLRATVDSGRTILLVGQREPCWQLAMALSHSAMGVAARLAGDLPRPDRWISVSTAAEVQQVDCDHAVDFSGDVSGMVSFCLQTRSALAWLPAPRLDKALMRFEIAAHPLDGPLVVPAAVDVAAVCAPLQQLDAKVIDVSEVVLADPAYRPRPLFRIGEAAFSQALVPCGVPTFGDDLRLAGHDVLMDEICRVVPSEAAAPPQRPPVSSPPQTGREPAGPPSSAASQDAAVTGPSTPGLLGEPVNSAPAEETMVDMFPHAADPGDPEHPPGWELDMIAARGEKLEQGTIGNNDAEEQEMAASFGLAPPPRPFGIRSSDAGSTAQALYTYPTGQHDGQVDVLDRATPQGADVREQEGNDSTKEAVSFSRILEDRKSREK